MRRLFLIRHAKSNWDDPALSDHARPLNARGRRGAAIIGRWLARRGDLPSLGIVSDARRTRETWAGIEAETGDLPECLEPALYEATPETILGILQAAPASASSVALVAHMPGIGEAARRLLAQPPSSADFIKYPTAATTIIEFASPDWQTIAWGSGRLLDFTTPRFLAED